MKGIGLLGVAILVVLGWPTQSPAQTMQSYDVPLVINVREAPFNAAGDGTTLDTLAINKAIDAVNLDNSPGREGPANNPYQATVLYFPAGTYVIDPAVIRPIIRHGVWVRGDGSGTTVNEDDQTRSGTATVLKRCNPLSAGSFTSKYGLIRAIPGVSGVKISDLAIDLNVQQSAGGDDNGATGIDLAQGSNARVVNCRIFSSNPIDKSMFSSTPTIYGITAIAASGLWVQDNHLEQTQIRSAGGGSAGPGIFVLDNRCYDVHDYAVSFISNGTNTTQRGARISGNLIRGIGGSGGVAVGRNGEYSSALAVNDVQVCNNQILGEWNEVASGIVLTAADNSHGWIVDNNILGNEAATLGNQTFGIHLNEPRDATFNSRLHDCLLMNNTVNGTSHEGMRLAGSNLRIIGNHLESTRGLRMASDRSLVVGNTLIGNRDWGLYLYSNARMSRSRILANIFRNTSGINQPAGILLETTGTGTIVADVFQNEFADDQSSSPQYHGVKHAGAGTFRLRYFDNYFRNLSSAFLSVPADAALRDNYVQP